jgi:hypothetical protein
MLFFCFFRLVEKKVKAPGWRRVWKNGHENGYENKRHLSAERAQKTFSQKNKKAARIFVRAAFAVWCGAMWRGVGDAVRCGIWFAVSARAGMGVGAGASFSLSQRSGLSQWFIAAD